MQDEEKKQEAFDILLLESHLPEDETWEPGGYDLMEHYINTKIGNPKRDALQLIFQLESTDEDDENALNSIAGVCAQEGVDLPGENWVIPPDIMQLHAVYHKAIQAESDDSEKTLLSFMINFTPVIGEIKAIIEALAGKDYDEETAIIVYNSKSPPIIIIEGECFLITQLKMLRFVELDSQQGNVLRI